VDPLFWPLGKGPRVYAAYDDSEALPACRRPESLPADGSPTSSRIIAYMDPNVPPQATITLQIGSDAGSSSPVLVVTTDVVAIQWDLPGMLLSVPIVHALTFAAALLGDSAAASSIRDTVGVTCTPAIGPPAGMSLHWQGTTGTSLGTYIPSGPAVPGTVTTETLAAMLDVIAAGFDDQHLVYLLRVIHG
jgi:hypothetical protein